ncbi:MAG: cysteine-rich CWC family protein [Bacteroidales bacterium]|nr:cysteine-rich CWC family protein [Bacteroidales bacterium]
MQKSCPKCHSAFECRNDNIMECACVDVILSAEDRNYISGKYDDCLCVDCLVELKVN